MALLAAKFFKLILIFAFSNNHNMFALLAKIKTLCKILFNGLHVSIVCILYVAMHV